MPVDNELYNHLYDTWWDENTVLGSMRTGLNPGRFGYFKQVLLEKLHVDLRGKKALHVGCGGGLLVQVVITISLIHSRPRLHLPGSRVGHAARESTAWRDRAANVLNTLERGDVHVRCYCHWCPLRRITNSYVACPKGISRVARR